MKLAPTAKDVVLTDGCAQLFRFRPKGARSGARLAPLLLVPSLINRWYVLDLRRGSSVAEALVGAELDTFVLNWGIPEAEDRYLSWDDVLGRLARAVKRVKRLTGAPKVGLLGYCMGATLSGIHAALHPSEVAALVNLAGPFDFAEGGFLRQMTDPRWFDVDSIVDAGNLSPEQMQSGFIALRPTQHLAKAVGYLHKMHDAAAREAFEALESWAGDNIPFPAEAYRRYIKELYQDNQLVRGEHFVGGRRVELGAITCPILTITAERDSIVPPRAARALAELARSTETEELTVPGGHVGAVVGSRASKALYPAMATWLERVLRQPGRTPEVAASA